ncbi:MAG: helix-turn-helix transcriptional regulator, partial [Microthrixaceae bacterium]
FLRTRRERVDPSSVGFPQGRNRRTPGLRREELAVLAGIGVSWLTRLEQGRANVVSAEVLDALASALRLNAVERAHLFTLAEVHLNPDPGSAPLDGPLRRLVDGLDPNPAYLLDHHWNLVAWNDAELELFPLLRDFGAADRPNLLRLFLERRELRSVIDDWSKEIDRLTRQFRFHLANFPDDELDQLASELRAAHPEFDASWEQHEVAPAAAHVRVVNAPAGRLRFDQHRLTLPDRPSWQLVVFIRLPDSSSATTTGAPAD